MKAVLFCLIRHRTKLEFSFSPYRYNISLFNRVGIRNYALSIYKNFASLYQTQDTVSGTSKGQGDDTVQSR